MQESESRSSERWADLVAAVRKGLSASADPQKAEPMRAYMKSRMPFLGVQAGPRRRICRSVFSSFPLDNRASWIQAILSLWREAEFREERYAAIDLAGYHKYRRYRSVDCMPAYEEMIVTGAWWDYVDELAVRHVGALLDYDQSSLEPTIRAWSEDDDIWKRRTAIICQIRRKERTDSDLLADCITPSMERKEFFLRKAIGWALRVYSGTDAEFVRSFVRQNSARLSPLSRREALRLLAVDS